MDRIKTLEQENKELRKQLHTAQAEISKRRHLFLQIEDFSSRLGATVQLKEAHRNCLQLFKDLFDLDYASLFLKKSGHDTMMMQDTLGFPEFQIGRASCRERVSSPV